MVINRSTSAGAKAKFDDSAVGELALISMYQVLLFLILQILVWVIMALIAILLPELGVITQQVGETLAYAVAALVDLVLIIVLARRGWRQFLENVEEARSNSDGQTSLALAQARVPFSETHLEAAFGATALGSLAWCLLIGLRSPSLQIVLVVVEVFALLFLLMFMAIRFLSTRKIRFTALACLVVTALSLWSLIRGWTI